jgi:hypothetical protein
MAEPEGAAPAIIADHPFTPRNLAEPWGLCECKLSEPAHLDTTVTLELSPDYRCPDCVSTTMVICTHRD